MHLPGYVARAQEIKARGVDEIVCLAVNDHFVMKAWAEQHGAIGVVTMLADGSGGFTRALGMDNDLSGAGLGVRGKRFSMLVEDGVVKSLDVEAKAGSVELTGADACLARL
jgi:peroxiredoxin